jgi:hypothetical protein
VLGCSNLKKLNFVVNSGACIAGLASAVRLGAGKGLHKIVFPRVDENVLAYDVKVIVTRCRKLKELDFAKNRGACVSWLAEAIADGAGKKLECINLKGSSASAAAVRAIVTGCPKLKQLNLRDCNAGVAGLVQAVRAGAVRTLRKINLTGTIVSREMVRDIVVGCADLESLNIRRCSGGFLGLMDAINAGFGKQLQSINMGFIRFEGFTQTDCHELMYTLARECIHLEVLDVSSCGSMIINALVTALQAIKSERGPHYSCNLNKIIGIPDEYRERIEQLLGHGTVAFKR